MKRKAFTLSLFALLLFAPVAQAASPSLFETIEEVRLVLEQLEVLLADKQARIDVLEKTLTEKENELAEVASLEAENERLKAEKLLADKEKEEAQKAQERAESAKEAALSALEGRETELLEQISEAGQKQKPSFRISSMKELLEWIENLPPGQLKQ